MFVINPEPLTLFSVQLYEKLVPKGHFLLELRGMVDWEELAKEVKPAFCDDNGRNSQPAVVVLKMLVLQLLYDLSDGAVEESVNNHLIMKYFCLLNYDVLAPDATNLVRFRDKLGSEGIAEIFNNVVKQCRKRGLITDRLRIVDSTEIKAKVDTYRMNSPNRPGPKKEPPDAEARYGYKRKNKPFFGYKAHGGMDADSELMTNLEVTPGNVSDSHVFAPLVRDKPEAVTADKGYDIPDNHEHLRKQEIADAIICKKNSGHVSRGGALNSRRKALRKRIEPKFGEAKNSHGMGRARYWGIEKMKRQVLLTAIVLNMKRMVKLIYHGAKSRRALYRSWWKNHLGRPKWRYDYAY